MSQLLVGRNLYIEKMPENILRVDKLSQSLVNSKYIYMKRNWYDVAISIEKFGSNFNWYGYNSVKWKHLINYVNSTSELRKNY